MLVKCFWRLPPGQGGERKEFRKTPSRKKVIFYMHWNFVVGMVYTPIFITFKWTGVFSVLGIVKFAVKMTVRVAIYVLYNVIMDFYYNYCAFSFISQNSMIEIVYPPIFYVHYFFYYMRLNRFFATEFQTPSVILRPPCMLITNVHLISFHCDFLAVSLMQAFKQP